MYIDVSKTCGVLLFSSLTDKALFFSDIILLSYITCFFVFTIALINFLFYCCVQQRTQKVVHEASYRKPPPPCILILP